MLKFTAGKNSSFEEAGLPELVYICHILLDETGQELHSHHSYAELMMVLEGTCIAHIDGGEEELTKGDFVLCRAGEPHCYRAGFGESAVVISAGFSHVTCCGLEENSFALHHEPSVVHAGAGGAALQDILLVLEHTAQMPAKRNDEVCRYLSAAAVTAALQLHQTAAERAEQNHYQLGVRAKVYLDRHYLEHLTLDSIAQAMGVSKYHLDRVFSAAAGCTPIQYITRRRLAHAQTLLASTDQSVKRIAEKCGYLNYNYFTALFRKNIGMTPGDYRKLTQGTGRKRGT